MKYYGRDRGSTIMGTTGTVLVDRDGYEIYDLKETRPVNTKRARTSFVGDLTRGGFYDRRALRELHCGYSDWRKAARSDLCRQRRGYYAAAFEHRVGSAIANCDSIRTTDVS